MYMCKTWLNPYEAIKNQLLSEQRRVEVADLAVTCCLAQRLKIVCKLDSVASNVQQQKWNSHHHQCNTSNANVAFTDDQTPSLVWMCSQNLKSMFVYLVHIVFFLFSAEPLGLKLDDRQRLARERREEKEKQTGTINTSINIYNAAFFISFRLFFVVVNLVQLFTMTQTCTFSDDGF